jgi:AraC-like DNA-binding protein
MLRRILESKRKLKQQPNLSLTEIAYSLGFTSSTQFGKTFKSFIGETPSEFRQRS